MDERLEEIDYVKGIAIISVIILHTVGNNFLYDSLAYFHIWQVVPIFILISFYLIFSKINKNSSLKSYYNFKKIKQILNRITIPFIVFQLITFIVILLINGYDKTKDIILYLGIGPGAYYPYIYRIMVISTIPL